MFECLGLSVASPLLEAGHPHINPLASPPLQAGGGKFSRLESIFTFSGGIVWSVNWNHFLFLLFFRRSCLVGWSRTWNPFGAATEQLTDKIVTNTGYFEL